MDKKINLPKRSKGDYAHSLLKVAAGTVPVAGSFLAEFVETVIEPPYRKRKEEWMREVANRIKELEEKVASFKRDSLKDNDGFLDAMISATKTALATSSKDKREQLLNALQNVVLNHNAGKITNTIFLNLIDKFTDAHVIICKILEVPNSFRAVRGEYDTKETYRELINKKLSDIDKNVIDIITKELHDNGLITISASGLDNPPPLAEEGMTRLTSLGKRLLTFIQKPNLHSL
jgi:hypothetical protein